MGAPRISWTPKGEGTASTTTLSEIAGLQAFRGETTSDRQTQFSKGGKYISISYDAWCEHEVRIEGVDRVNHPIDWHKIAALVAHVQQGGEFEFARDVDRIANTTLSVPLTKGDTVVVCDTSDMVAGETLLVEDLDDVLRRDFWRIASVDTGAQITLSYGTVIGFIDGSPIRSADFFPKCVGTARRAVQWDERDAGGGAYLWDFRLRFRTVR